MAGKKFKLEFSNIIDYLDSRYELFSYVDKASDVKCSRLMEHYKVNIFHINFVSLQGKYKRTKTSYSNNEYDFTNLNNEDCFTTRKRRKRKQGSTSVSLFRSSFVYYRCCYIKTYIPTSLHMKDAKSKSKTFQTA